MTATELDGPMQRPLGNSELSSSVCDRLLLSLLWLKSWPLESLRFALNLVLNASFHLHRNEPFLRGEQDGRSPLLPGGRCQRGSNLAEVGKEEEMLAASAYCSCLPSPSWRASPYLLDTALVPCLLPCARGQVAPNSDALPWSVCCTLSRWSKLKDVGRFQERQSKGLTLCFNLLLSQICWGEGVLLCWSVDLCGECSAWFLFEMWEGRREDLFSFFYDLCFQ